MAILAHNSEIIDREELAQLQLERLQSSIFRAYRNVSYYRKQFDALGFSPEDLQSLEQLSSLPFTTKDDVRNGYPYDLLAVPLREVVRLHNSSWTIGRPIVCAFTKNDLRHWHDLVARLLSAAGVTRDDVIQMFFLHGLPASWLGFHGGAESLGSSVIPASAYGIDQQIAILQDFRTSVIVGTSSDAACLAARIEELGLDNRRLSLRVGFFGAEPWSEEERANIERYLGITALDYYGFAEIGGAGFAGECPCKNGLHLAEDHFLAEVVDPATGHVLPEGEEGELVVTTLTKEALPLIRFRTHDLTRLETQPCACGRTLARMARVSRRTDDLLFVQGHKLYPAQIEAILTDIEHATPHFQMVIERKAGLDEIELQVELLPNALADTPKKLVSLEQRIFQQLQDATGLSPRVHLMEPQTIERLAGEQVVDKRRVKGEE